MVTPGLEGLARLNFRLTFDTTSNGLFRAIVSHPSGKSQVFINENRERMESEIWDWANKVMKGD